MTNRVLKLVHRINFFFILLLHFVKEVKSQIDANEVTWTNVSPDNAFNYQWKGIISNANGEKLAAWQNVAGKIYLSTDSGNSWIAIYPEGSSIRTFTSMSSSSSGQIVVATAQSSNGGVYYSNDYGQNFALQMATASNDKIWWVLIATVIVL